MVGRTSFPRRRAPDDRDRTRARSDSRESPRVPRPDQRTRTQWASARRPDRDPRKKWATPPTSTTLPAFEAQSKKAAADAAAAKCRSLGGKSFHRHARCNPSKSLANRPFFDTIRCNTYRTDVVPISFRPGHAMTAPLWQPERSCWRRGLGISRNLSSANQVTVCLSEEYNGGIVEGIKTVLPTNGSEFDHQ